MYVNHKAKRIWTLWTENR